MLRLVILAALFGAASPVAAQDRLAPDPQPAYERKATWAETMIAARSNCLEWVTSDKPKDGKLAGTPIPALWSKIRADWAEHCGWFAHDLPRDRHLDWFLRAGDISFEIWILRTLPELGELGVDLRQELDDLRRTKSAPSDPRWLELYARAKRLKQMLATTDPIWLGELRVAFVGQTLEMIRSKIPSEDPRWAVLNRHAAQCAERGAATHAGSVAELRAAIELLGAALPGRFAGGDTLLNKLVAAESRWNGIIAGVLSQEGQAFGQLTALQEEVLEFRRSLLRAVRGMPEFLETWSGVGLEEEWENQFAALRHDLANRATFEKVAGETFRPESLVLSGDRDPADIVLRRTAALWADLGRARTKAAAFDAVLAGLQKANAAIPPPNAEARYVLYAETCRLRRQVGFSNPLLDFDELVFVKRHRAIFNHMCDQFYGITARPGGGLCVLKNPFGPNPEVRDVLADSIVEKGRLKGQRIIGGNGAVAQLRWDGDTWLTGDETEGGAFLSPALSYDAKQILFAYVECRGDRGQKVHTEASSGHWNAGRCYHIFKVNADGTGLEQVTDGTWNEFDPCWLPNGRIAFISERRGGYLRCGRACPLYNLYDMSPDGTGINLLSFHDSNEWNPSVTHDGRIVWTRWDYVDRHGCVAHVPWITRLDGTDPRALHGNFAVRQQRADMELNVRPIPGSRKYVATAAPHHGQAFGSLVIIDPRVEDDDAMGPVRRITPDVGFPESQGGSEVYGTAWPLSEDYYLCVYDVALLGDRARLTPGNYGIYLVDAFGNKELVYRDPEIGCSNPVPLRPTPKPVVTVNPQLAADCKPIKPGDTGEGTMAVVNVYSTMRPWPHEMKVKELRIYQLLPCSVPSGGGAPHQTGKRVAEAGDSIVPARWVLGTVPVEVDGSAYFKVPAYRELFFQLIDERGMAVQSMRSGTAIRNGENLVCQGCHEPKHRAATAAVMPLALQRPPSAPKPDADGSNPYSYPRLVQPVLDRNCVACHDKNPDKAPNLNREPIQNKFFASYNSLVKYGFTSYGDHYRTVSGKFGARASKLIEMLDKGHHEVKLSSEDFHRFTLWLDSVSLFYGVFEKEGGEAQLRGEVARPTLE